MDRLWTPWRYDYVSRAQDTSDASTPGVPEALNAWPLPGAQHHGCVFCNMIAAVDHALANGMSAEEAEKHAHILLRGPLCFLCLNAFPYAPATSSSSPTSTSTPSPRCLSPTPRR